MIVLIIGPSGVGKTTTCVAAKRQLPDTLFEELDGLVARWGVEQGLIPEPMIRLLDQRLGNAELLLDVGLFAIGELAGKSQKKNLVIDVGAGFQIAPSAAFLNRVYPVVAITAHPEVAFQRNQTQYREELDFNTYLDQEFSPSRVALYESARHSIDSTEQTEEQTCREFVEILGKALPKS